GNYQKSCYGRYGNLLPQAPRRTEAELAAEHNERERHCNRGEIIERFGDKIVVGEGEIYARLHYAPADEHECEAYNDGNNERVGYYFYADVLCRRARLARAAVHAERDYRENVYRGHDYRRRNACL